MSSNKKILRILNVLGEGEDAGEADLRDSANLAVACNPFLSASIYKIRLSHRMCLRRKDSSIWTKNKRNSIRLQSYIWNYSVVTDVMKRQLPDRPLPLCITGGSDSG